MPGNFGVFSFLRSWQLTPFLTTCLGATSSKIWTFCPFLHLSETTRKKSALQHSLFWRYVNFSKIMRTIHTSMTSTFILNLSHLLNVKHWTFSHWNVLVLHICIVHINLEKLADNVKPWMLYRGFLTGSQDRFVLKFQGVALSESILMKVWDIII